MSQISEASYFKIHPAIGVARIANNEDYFEFFESFAKDFKPSEDYMSVGGPNDLNPGKKRIKRQAVQFSIYAYDQNDNVIGNVKDLCPLCEIHWTADVGNRKLFNYGEKRGKQINPIQAKGTASRPQDITDLLGQNPWEPTKKINLGAISGTGLFIPAKGGVTREKANSKIDHYPANQDERANDGTRIKLECTDSTCDGEISAVILKEGVPMNQTILPAWIISAPPQHAIALTPTEAAAGGSSPFNPRNANNNKDWVQSTKNLLGITNPNIYDPTELDAIMMKTLNADYNPGMEINLSRGRIENGAVPANFFYDRNTNLIKENEIRVQPNQEGNKGAIPGQLTSGLCSTWQGDMMLCLNWWTAENPSTAFGPNDQREVVIYKEGDVNTRMNEPEEINTYMDFRGIVENSEDTNPAKIRLDLAYDPNRPNNA